MPFKIIQAEIEIKEAGAGGRTISGLASTFGPPADSVGDVVVKGAYKKTLKEGGFSPRTGKATIEKPRIKLFYLHRDPLGRLNYLKETNEGLEFEGAISRTAQGDDVVELIRDGVVDKMSIGYSTVKERSDEENGWNLLEEVKLFEVSPVPFPANDRADILDLKNLLPHMPPQLVARQLVASLGLKARDFDGLFVPSTETKAVVSFQDFPLAAIDRAWSKAEADERVRSWADAEDEPNAKFRSSFVWYDAEAEDLFGSYKFPIADVINGELFAIPRAIFAAAGRLDQADIPSGDKEKIRNHLSRYYAKMRRDFDRDDLLPPWEKSQVIELLEKATISLTETVGALKTLLAKDAEEEPIDTPEEPTEVTPDAEPEEITPDDELEAEEPEEGDEADEGQEEGEPEDEAQEDDPEEDDLDDEAPKGADEALATAAKINQLLSSQVGE